MKEAIDEFSRSGPAKDPLWSDFAKRLSYVQGSFDDVELLQRAQARSNSRER
jgi:glucose-6-phosphate 1-dehydrogenase